MKHGTTRNEAAKTSAPPRPPPATFVRASCLGLLVSMAASALDLPLTVKECAGVGALNYPVTAVIPFAHGVVAAESQFRVLSPEGSEVLSQWEILERWRDDGSLRHIRLQFLATIPPEGRAVYRLQDEPAAMAARGVVVNEEPTQFTMVTGPLRCVVPRTDGRLLAGVWLDADGDGLFADGEKIVTGDAHTGGVFAPRMGAGGTQFDGERSRLSAVLEESGPVRAVIRLESPARFRGTNDHDHGFAVRLYAYAGQSSLRIDYQLQNSDRTVAHSWPLHFESMNLEFPVALSGPVRTRVGGRDGAVLVSADGGGALLSQVMHNRFRVLDPVDGRVRLDPGTLPDGVGPDAFVEVSEARWGVVGIMRHFWQTWPNGIRADASGRLSFQLFPEWSAQWHESRVSPSGLYWVEDMQHVVKEMLLSFHGPEFPESELIRQARTFQDPPVVVVSRDWYRQTRATLDLGGVVPAESVIPPGAERRRPDYSSVWLDPSDGQGWYGDLWLKPEDPHYGAGWANFGDPEPGYRNTGGTTGGWPYGNAYFLASGSPADARAAEDMAFGEVNLRPEWMAEYRHDVDGPLLKLTENPYEGGSWRIFEGWDVPLSPAPRLPGTGTDPAFFARDDQHGWFYHVAEAYWLTGNPWLKDWYRFVGEFRRVRTERLDPYPDTVSRATGHALSHALQAARITGDSAALGRMAEHIRRHLRPEQDPRYGDQRDEVEPLGGGFQTGYLMRFLVNYLEELRSAGMWQEYSEGFNYLSGFMQWNLNHGHFPYYLNARTGMAEGSSGTGLTLVDPQSWYYWHTGRHEFWEQVDSYVTKGLGGGERPYGRFDQWHGQFEGRYYLTVKTLVREHTVPPPPMSEVEVVPGGGRVLIRWVAPPETVRAHVVWGFKPITALPSTNTATLNWWAANAVGTAPDNPGRRRPQRVVIEPGSGGPVFAAVFGFDAADNMSALSAVASTVGIDADHVPPVIKPWSVTAYSCPRCPTNGVSVTMAGSEWVNDDRDPEPRVEFTPASGGNFAVGTHEVPCVATDFAGNAASATGFVVVKSGVPGAGMVREGDLLRLELPRGCVHYHYERCEDLARSDGWRALDAPVLSEGGSRSQRVAVRGVAEYFRISNR